LNNNETNRRKFLKYLILIPGVFTAYLADSLIKKTDFNNYKSYSLPYSSIKNGITFIDDIIFVKKNNKLSVFSDKCTHLGCKIRIFNDDTFICPCHGSAFDINGKVIKGPALKNLTQLKYKIDNNKNQVMIYIKL